MNLSSGIGSFVAVQCDGRSLHFMRWVYSLGSIEKLIKFTSDLVSWRQLAMCITMTVVIYEIKSLYVGLAVKAISESFIGK